MEKIEARMEAAEQEEIKEESSSGYLVEEELTTLKEKCNINQMAYESERKEIT